MAHGQMETIFFTYIDSDSLHCQWHFFFPVGSLGNEKAELSPGCVELGQLLSSLSYWGMSGIIEKEMVALYSVFEYVCYTHTRNYWRSSSSSGWMMYSSLEEQMNLTWDRGRDFCFPIHSLASRSSMNNLETFLRTHCILQRKYPCSHPLWITGFWPVASSLDNASCPVPCIPSDLWLVIQFLILISLVNIITWVLCYINPNKPMSSGHVVSWDFGVEDSYWC